MKLERPHHASHEVQKYRQSHTMYLPAELPQGDEESTEREAWFSHRFVGFRLTRGDEEPTPQVAMGSLHELLPVGARRMEWDDEEPDLTADNVGFRLTRTNEDLK